MCRVQTAQFEAMSASVRLARRWVGELLERWELPELVESATLLTSEVVTNAILHAQSGPTVVAAVADGVVEVGVSDEERLPPGIALGRTQEGMSEALRGLSEGGRGLLLIDVLADEWGIANLAGGKQVWFRLTARDWSYRSACRCHSDDVGRVRLESGAYALALAGDWDHPTPAH